MKDPRKMKDAQDSQLTVKRIVEKVEREDGYIRNILREELIEEPLELGSIMKPLNTDVHSFRYVVKGKNDVFSPFGFRRFF